jgi:tetratricopeptide (TPR) repeat protein
VLSSQGKYLEAEQMHRQALELKEEVLGREHPDTLGSMNNLAETFRHQGKYLEAEQMHQQALDLYKKVLGQKHPDTIRCENNLQDCLKQLREKRRLDNLPDQNLILPTREKKGMKQRVRKWFHR